MPRGLLITFEGGEGLGKSTQIELLVQKLRRHKVPHIITREPGGTPAGELLRTIHKEFPILPLTEVFILEASRHEHVEKVIRPALAEGKIVICDRYSESSVVYQGYVRGLSVSMIKNLNKLATGNLKPNRVIMLDGKIRRLKGRSKKDKFDNETNAFHEKIRKGYLRLARENKYIRVYQADQSKESLHQQILKDLTPLLKQSAKSFR